MQISPDGRTLIKVSDSDISKNGCFTIPNGVTNIEREAFRDCKSLTSIEMPSSVTNIDDNVFFGCIRLKSIEIPNSVTNIGELAFHYCKSLTSIKIPNSVTNIGLYAFHLCESLTSIEIPNGVTSIEGFAFSGCRSLTSIKIPNSVTSIGSWAFEGCESLTSIEIPISVTSIGIYAFSGCESLTGIEIPSSVTNIGEGAFSGCRSLASIEIPNSVTSIGIYAFSGCTSLSYIVADDKDIERIKSLLPRVLKNKVIKKSIYEKASNIIKHKLEELQQVPELNPIYNQVIHKKGKSKTLILIPNEIFGLINSYLDEQDYLPCYKKVKDEITSIKIPFSEMGLPALERDINKIIEKFKKTAEEQSKEAFDPKFFGKSQEVESGEKPGLKGMSILHKK